jgi:hypothetical protein
MREQLIYVGEHVKIHIRDGEYVIEPDEDATQEDIDRARRRCGLPIEVSS